MNKRNAYTLVEISIVTVILVMVMAALFMVLNVGNLSHSLNSEKIMLYQETRDAMHWVCRDIRQTTAAEILSNPYSASALSFRIYSGFDSGSPQWSSATIDYSYNSDSSILTRTDNNTGLVRTFENISTAPFDLSELADDLVGVDLTVSRNVRGRDISVSLLSEIKIRNE